MRSEVSGRRLWGLFAERFDSAKAFMGEHFVANYCPLVFMEESARNITPDKLPASLKQPLEAVCDQHLSQLISILQPQWVVGVGNFAGEVCAPRHRSKCYCECPSWADTSSQSRFASGQQRLERYRWATTRRARHLVSIGSFHFTKTSSELEVSNTLEPFRNLEA